MDSEQGELWEGCSNMSRDLGADVKLSSGFREKPCLCSKSCKFWLKSNIKKCVLNACKCTKEDGDPSLLETFCLGINMRVYKI